MTHSLSAAPNLHLTFHQQAEAAHLQPNSRIKSSRSLTHRHPFAFHRRRRRRSLCLPAPHAAHLRTDGSRATQRCCCARRRECCRGARISADYADSFLFCSCLRFSTLQQARVKLGPRRRTPCSPTGGSCLPVFLLAPSSSQPSASSPPRPPPPSRFSIPTTPNFG